MQASLVELQVPACCVGATASAFASSVFKSIGIDESFVVDSAIKQLGETLARAEKRPSRTVKDVHKICMAVTPVMTLCLREFFGNQLGSKPEQLKLLHESQIPSLLLKYLGLTLRAGHPVTPLPAAAEEASSYACKSYTMAVEFLTGLLGTCLECYNSRSYMKDCQAVLEQLQPFSEAREPGRG